MSNSAKKKKQHSAGRYESLAERAYHHIEEMIVTLQLEPGAVLSEQQLAEELSVGRSPVREAIQRLAYEKLVVVLPRRGILVSDINLRSHRKLLLVRREVERLMVRLACNAATEVQIAGFRKFAADFQRHAKDNDVRGFVRTDAAFNELLAESVDNEFARNAVQMTRGLSRRFWFKYYRLADLKKCASLHAALAKAIAERNADEAGRALDRLIDYMEEFTRAVLDVH
jgi:DNA-binding GntR family transcriptional regulator